MKNVLKLISVFVFLAIFGFSFTFRSQASNSVSDNDKTPKGSSRSVFLNNCARCHGGGGKAETEIGKSKDTPDISGGKVKGWSSAKLTRIITNGDGEMPAFGKKLSKAQIAGLVNYVRGL